MDEQVFSLLNEKINTVDKKVDDIGKDVKEMLQFKWQIIGGSVVVSAILSIAISLFTK